MSEPREWWIRPEASYSGELIFEEDPTTYWPMTKGECVNVIEKSAYDSLKEALFTAKKQRDEFELQCKDLIAIIKNNIPK